MTDDPRGKILDAAAEEFADRGFDGARVDSIAERAGVNKAALYYHIGDKAALYKEVLRLHFGRIFDQIRREDDPTLSAEERLERLVTIMAANIGGSPVINAIIIREVASGGQFPCEVMDVLSQVVGTLRGIVADGVAGDEFRIVDFFVLHMAIVGGINFYFRGRGVRERVRQAIAHGALPPEIDEPAKVGRELARLLLHGLKARHGGEE